ncbi:hypothetical protein [Streptomyces sp. URMC 129]|uniref:hypothetical protein n=1 Tax=Streptomyces sp. URMC 129 TaxID=3423407 RepID=UPI003F1B4B87
MSRNDVAARRAEVRRLAAEGLSGRAIAQRLGVGQGTVRRDLEWLAAEEAAPPAEPERAAQPPEPVARDEAPPAQPGISAGQTPGAPGPERATAAPRRRLGRTVRRAARAMTVWLAPSRPAPARAGDRSAPPGAALDTAPPVPGPAVSMAQAEESAPHPAVGALVAAARAVTAAELRAPDRLYLIAALRMTVRALAGLGPGAPAEQHVLVAALGDLLRDLAEAHHPHDQHDRTTRR